MTEAIEFEVTEKLKRRLMTEDGLGVVHPTTPAEFDAVARQMGYYKPGSNGYPGSADGDVIALLCEQANEGEDIDDTLRRIIRENEKLKITNSHVESLNSGLSEQITEWHKEKEHTCLIDDVTYRGNEETIGKLNDLLFWREQWKPCWQLLDKTRVPTDLNYPMQLERHIRELADFKRQLEEAEVCKASRLSEIDAYRRQLEEAKAHSVVCAGVEYVGNKETINHLNNCNTAMVRIRESLGINEPCGTRFIADKAIAKIELQLASPLPEKWRKAMERICSMTGDSDELLAAASMLIDIIRIGTGNHTKSIACVGKIILNRLAAELEKEQP